MESNAHVASSEVVHIDTTGYPISIGAGLLDQACTITQRLAKAHRYVIISDTTVAPLYADRVAKQFPLGATHIFTIPAGEKHKNRDSWASLTDQLLANGFTRDTTILALGGGVVGDLAGFVAATFMRGIPFIQLPTTLLAMIDASIGGKTGVDTPAGKNLVGAFHPPAAVVIDPQVLTTLALTDLRAGLAEAVKHGAIADETYFTSLSDAATKLLAPAPTDRDARYVAQLIEHSVRIKATVVARDTHEHGVRKILNFGHTVGHAIELLSDFALSHGDAVAVGMVMESAAAEEAGVTESGTTDRIITTLTQLGLPTERPTGPTPDQIINVMRGDKKSRAGAIEYAVPARIGTMAGATSGYAVRIDDAIIHRVLRHATHA